MEPPFLPSSLVQAYLLGEILDLMEPPYLTNSNKILTVPHLEAFSGHLGCPETRQTTQTRHLQSKLGVASAKVGVA